MASRVPGQQHHEEKDDEEIASATMSAVWYVAAAALATLVWRASTRRQANEPTPIAQRVVSVETTTQMTPPATDETVW
jgi:heme/copper-type cytochrome/quinol oxidase subunit 2